MSSDSKAADADGSRPDAADATTAAVMSLAALASIWLASAATSPSG